MSAILTIACVHLMPFVTAQSPPQRSASPNVAVINLARVFERYQMTQDLEQMFAQRRQDLKSEAERKRDDIGVLGNALQQFKPGTEDYRQREEKLVRAEIEFEVWLDVQERRLKSEHKGWLERIYSSTQDVVAKIAGERGLDLVLTYSDLERDAPDSVAFKQQILLRTVIYADERIDLTNGVIDVLNTDYQRRGGAGSRQVGPTLPPDRP